MCSSKTLILVLNKSDLQPASSSSNKIDLPQNVKVVSLSAKQKQGLDKLQSLLIETAHIPEISQNEVVVTNIRHYEALTNALAAMADGLPSDLISQDLRECLHHLAEITGGEITSEETLQNIFKHFCIGK